MNRQEVLRLNHSVFVAYVFPGVLWARFVDGRDGHFCVLATVKVPVPSTKRAHETCYCCLPFAVASGDSA
jgi:hypothetical protein